MQTPTAIKQVTKHSEVLQTAELIMVYLKKKKQIQWKLQEILIEVLLKSKETQLPYLNSKLSVKEVVWEEKPAQVGNVPTAMITLNYNFMNKLTDFQF